MTNDRRMHFVLIEMNLNDFRNMDFNTIFHNGFELHLVFTLRKWGRLNQRVGEKDDLSLTFSLFRLNTHIQYMLKKKFFKYLPYCLISVYNIRNCYSIT